MATHSDEIDHQARRWILFAFVSVSTVDDTTPRAGMASRHHRWGFPRTSGNYDLPARECHALQNFETFRDSTTVKLSRAKYYNRHTTQHIVRFDFHLHLSLSLSLSFFVPLRFHLDSGYRPTPSLYDQRSPPPLREKGSDHPKTRPAQVLTNCPTHRPFSPSAAPRHPPACA
jgi:hypothetical protein